LPASRRTGPAGCCARPLPSSPRNRRADGSRPQVVQQRERRERASVVRSSRGRGPRSGAGAATGPSSTGPSSLQPPRPACAPTPERAGPAARDALRGGRRPGDRRAAGRGSQDPHLFGERDGGRGDLAEAVRRSARHHSRRGRGLPGGALAAGVSSPKPPGPQPAEGNFPDASTARRPARRRASCPAAAAPRPHAQPPHRADGVSRPR
jgi:hypothetical protein